MLYSLSFIVLLIFSANKSPTIYHCFSVIPFIPLKVMRLIISSYPKAEQMPNTKAFLTCKKIFDSRFEKNISYWQPEIQSAYKKSYSL